MNLNERLTKYNAWRRGETDDPQPHPKQIGKDIDEAIAKLAAAERLVEARPIDEWHEDDGPALFWFFPIAEPPFAGTPGDYGWVHDCYTHWTPIPLPNLAAAKKEAGR